MWLIKKIRQLWPAGTPAITQVIPGDATAGARCRYTATEWVLWQNGSTRLTHSAINKFNGYIRQHPAAILAYSDHRVTGKMPGDDHTLLKPGWSLELVRASAYPGEVLAIRGDAFADYLQHTCSPTPYELMLYLGARYRDEQFIHIPKVLWTTTTACGVFRQRYVKQAILKNHLDQQGIKAEIVSTPQHYLKRHYALPPRQPMVSIIIPTRNMLHYLEPCISSILEKTTYGHYEIIVVDNQSDEKETLDYLTTLSQNNNIRVLHYPHPFNFSAINNFAARHAQGDVLCLLNNDTAVISPDWLEQLVSHLLQPGVGVVGAKLLYADGTVQHAGDAVGVAGCAGHMHAGLDAQDPGYMGRAILTQDLSAVTGACLLTHASLYRELGGLDAEHLAVAFNDVDYCLRVREARQKVIMVPDALLYHYESVSRGGKKDPEKKKRMKKEVAYMHNHWKKQMSQDPFYHPDMNKQKADFTLAARSRFIRFWK